MSWKRNNPCPKDSDSQANCLGKVYNRRTNAFYALLQFGRCWTLSKICGVSSKHLFFLIYIYYIYVNILLSLCIYYRECLNKNFEFVDPVDIGMMTPPRQLPFCSSSRSSSVSSTVNTPLFYEDTSASNDPYSTPFVQQRNKRKRDVQVCFSGEDGTESAIF